MNEQTGTIKKNSRKTAKKNIVGGVCFSVFAVVFILLFCYFGVVFSLLWVVVALFLAVFLKKSYDLHNLKAVVERENPIQHNINYPLKEVSTFKTDMRVLVVQTASIGDVILTTPIMEKIHAVYPNAQIDICIESRSSSLFVNHPYLNRVFVWKKSPNKYAQLFQLIKEIRKQHYNYVINVNRFFAAGLVTMLAKKNYSFGFDKNPLSFLFTKKYPHEFAKNLHETDRNQRLIELITDKQPAAMKLYPDEAAYNKIESLKESPYICISPTSLWFTKQYPKQRWIEFISAVPENITVFLLGSKADAEYANDIMLNTTHQRIKNLCGTLSLLESAALMAGATMNYVNDSAPMHLASAMDAPLTAIFCSTVTDFGFGPMSSRSTVIETEEKLACRPCGLHGKKACPLQHFACGYGISIDKLLTQLNTTQQC